MNSNKHKHTHWNDNESRVEHHLTNFSTDVERLSTGPVDFYSPSRALIQKEEPHTCTMHEDAKDCARKLTLLIIEMEASKPSGISRSNACAALRIASAVRFHCYDEKLEEIGQLINKDRRVVSRYSQRFISWVQNNRDRFSELVTPNHILSICYSKATTLKPPHIILEELRLALFDLLYELVEAATKPENHEREIFTQTDRFKWDGFFNFAEILEAFSPNKEA